MGSPDDEFAADLSPRDLLLLKLRMKHPTAPVRELRDILETEHGVDLSHNRVNELLRELETDDVFRLEAAPNRDLFEYHLFRVGFDYANYEGKWEACYWDLMEDPHVVLFANTDDRYSWTLVTQFNDAREAENWVHHFFRDHGELVAEFDNKRLPTVHKFFTDGDVLDERLAETEAGRAYLGHDETADGPDDARSVVGTRRNDD